MRTTGQYKSLMDLVRKLYQSEGWKVFYRGYFANSLGGMKQDKEKLKNKIFFLILVFPAAGIDFALYEYLRRVYREKVTSLEEPSIHIFSFFLKSFDFLIFLGILTLTMISNVSALAAMYASYPLYLIRTRQQYQIVPENMFEMMGRIWRYKLNNYFYEIFFLYQ